MSDEPPKIWTRTMQLRWHSGELEQLEWCMITGEKRWNVVPIHPSEERPPLAIEVNDT